jgi:AraC-like DNA-binding protein
MVSGDEPYVVGDGARSDPIAVIGPDQACTSVGGAELSERFSHGTRLWGNDPTGEDAMLIATYGDVGEVGRLVTDVLPGVAVIPAGTLDASLIELLSSELGADRFAQGSVIDRLVDVLLITALRAWIGEHGSGLPGWIGGATAPAVASALEAIHERPAEPWTIAALASVGNVSRATLAARFTEQVGLAPIAYLTRWRLSIARDLLVDDALTLAAVADRVGYGSAFAFSTAFTKAFGVSPSVYRSRLRSAPASRSNVRDVV